MKDLKITYYHLYIVFYVAPILMYFNYFNF